VGPIGGQHQRGRRAVEEWSLPVGELLLERLAVERPALPVRVVGVLLDRGSASGDGQQERRVERHQLARWRIPRVAASELMWCIVNNRT
jgi:hypothetical protein